MSAREVTVRPAENGEATAVIGLLDAALLAFDREAVRERIAGEAVRVAVHEETIRGAIVLDGDHIEAIAVRPRYRRQGIGRALVGAVGADHPVLTATCDRDELGFYEALGFEVTEQSDGGYFLRLE